MCTVALLACFLATALASPIESKKEQSVETPGTAAPTIVAEEPGLSPLYVSEGETAKDAAVKQEEAEEVNGRKARTLGFKNQVNEVGGAKHQFISDPEDALLQKLNNKCSQSDVSSCVMLKLVTYMNRLLKKSNIELFEGFHITQTASQEQVKEESQRLENPRSTGNDDEDTQLSQLMANKLWTFVRTRSLRWSVLPDSDLVLSTSPDEEGSLGLGMSVRTGKAVEKGEYDHLINLQFLNI
jgi:hypothetical protein